MPLKILFDGVDPAVDVAAIHGLNPFNNQDHGVDTWEKNGRLWLRDNFKDVFPRARTLLYTYNSSPAFGSNKERFIYEANELLERLRIQRRKNPKRPLILLGHSLGGILIKQALVNAQANSRYIDILNSTFGLVFFGTPHAGATTDAKVFFGKVCARVAKKIIGHPQNDIMEALEKNSLFSDVLQESWRHQLESYQIVSFYEGIGDLVPRDSAVIGLSGEREYAVRLNAEHSDMCRFDLSIQNDEDNYQLVEANLEELCTEALKQEVELTEDIQTEILQNLESASRNPRFREISTAYEESFQWLWDDDDAGPGFVDWLRTGSEIYWISGKPGSGKSTLMKHIVEDPRALRFLAWKGDGSGLVLPVRYAFYDQSSIGEKSHLGMISAILYQLIKGSASLIPAILPIWDAAIKMAHYGPGQVKLTSGDIEDCIFAISRQRTLQGTICLFMDGLDECLGNWHQELKFLTRLVEVKAGQKLIFKACISSRYENTIRDYLENFPGFRIHDRTFNDVLNYVQSQLADRVVGMSCGRGAERYTGRDLIEDVVKKASGVFMWVRLAVHDLMEGCAQGDDMDELRKSLSELPPDLESFHGKILDRIENKYIHESILYFELVSASETPTYEFPLTLIRFGLAMKPTWEAISCTASIMDLGECSQLCERVERRIQSRCRNLLEVSTPISTVLAESEANAQKCSPSLPKSTEVPRVIFLHKTAKDYLNKQDTINNLLVRSSCTPDNAWVQLMGLCLRQLKLDSASQPFRGDAWVQIIAQFLYFARRSETSKGVSQTSLMKAMDSFLRKEHQGWCTMWWMKYRAQCRFSVTFFALTVRSGCVLYVEENVKNVERSIDQPKELIKKPLPSLPFGNSEVARPLLFFSLDIGMMVDEWLPEDMIEVLLGHGSNVNDSFEGVSFWQQVLFGMTDFLVPMHAERVLSLLLDYGANVSETINVGGYRCPPFHQYIHALKNVAAIKPIFVRFHNDNCEISSDFAQWRRSAKSVRGTSPTEWPTGREAVADDSTAFLYYKHISSMMKKFMDHGSDLSSKDSNGESVWDLCEGMPTVRRFLRDFKNQPMGLQEPTGTQEKMESRKISWSEKMAGKLKILKR